MNGPLYNMQAAVRLTGVPADTLRSWERRYGFPTPQRTPTARRRYSVEDVEAIRWVRGQTEHGLSVSEAVRQALSRGAGPSAARDSGTAPTSPDGLVPLLVAAAAAYDEQQLETVLASAFAQQQAPVVVTDVILPALVAIGDGWAQGELDAAVEHFASNVVRRRLLALLTQLPAPRAASAPVLACVPGEYHDLGLLALALFLRWEGIAVIYLGANVPVADLLQCLRLTQASVLCLSATAPESAGALLRTIGELHARGVELPIIVGGPAAARVQLPLGARSLATDLHRTAAAIAVLARGR